MSIFRKIFHGFSFSANIIVSGLLILSYLSGYITPSERWWLAFLGLAFPYLALLNIFFFFYWLLKARLEFLLSLITFLIGINLTSAFVKIPFKKPIEPSELAKIETIKVMTYNVRMFDFWDLAHDPEDRKKMLAFIKRENPDILCLQEFFTIEKSGYKAAEIFSALSYLPYSHVHVFSNNNGKYGIATFSRYPIVRRKTIPFEGSSNATIISDLVIKGDTFRIINNHLQSIHFIKKNYDFVEKFQLSKADTSTYSGILDITKRLRNAFILRSQQVQTVSNKISGSPYPVIVCGDFNDTPNSFTYQKMRRGLKDSFVEAGSGISHTYKGTFPSFRIDYILYSPALEAITYATPKIPYSDHYPVVSHLRKR